MGRTLPTFNTFLQAEESSWRDFRRSLRSADEKEAFEALFTRARIYAAESTAAARPVPFDAIIMSILLSQEIEIRDLKRVIRSHERALEEAKPDAHERANELPEEELSERKLPKQNQSAGELSAGD